MDWKWIATEAAIAIHHGQIAQHGGPSGVRESQLLESAMARPINLVTYTNPDIAMLASSYAFGIASNHPFTDGNKRTAAVVSETFLVINGWQLTANDAELVVAIQALAASKLDEEELADWFRQHIVQYAK